MSNKTESARAVCPFWRDSGGKKIRCEGIVSMNIENGFESVRERELHEARFCDAIYRYRECPIASAILRRWEKE
jgi:hypothetical protein